MKMTKTTTSAAVGASLLLAATPAFASTVIVAESFGGLFSEDLNATAADTFAQGVIDKGGSKTWVARADFNADGSVLATASGGSAYLDLGTYINDSKNTPTGKFELKATISPVTTTNSWLALGFASQATPNVNRNFTNSPSTGSTTTGYANMVYRPTGDIDQWAGSLATNPVAVDDILFTGSRTLTITLDFTPLGGYNGTSNFGKVSFGADTGALGAYQEFGSYTYTANAPIGSLLLGFATTGVSGAYSSLTLTQIPEPTAALLGGFGLLALPRRRRA